jgi:tetratricopeptide (TPR) repeat protein
MARRYFNWKLIIVLVLGIVILGATASGLRQWQKSRRAQRGLALGNKAYDEHNWEEAASQLGRYLGVVQNDSPVLLKYAEAQLNIRPLKQSNLQQAIAAYRNVLRLDQSNSNAAKRLSEIYLNVGMPAEAELITTRSLAARESEDLRKTLAIALAAQRKFTEAENELKEIVKKNPAQIPAYELLGRLIEQHPDEFSEAPGFWFNEAIKKNPSSAEAYIARSDYNLHLGDRAGAIADLEQAQQKDINDSAVRLRLAKELINTNVLDDAQKQLEIVQTSEPANQNLWRLWAQIAFRSDSNDFILKVADAGLKELSAQPWDFMPYAAELFIKCSRFDRAKECIGMMRQKDIAPATTAFLEGLLAERQGLDREAVKCWKEAIQLDSKSPRIRLSISNVLWRLGDRQSAINHLRTLVSQQPTLPDGRIALAQMLSDTGQWAEAQEQINIAKQLAPDSNTVDLLDARVKLQLLANARLNKDSSQYGDLKVLLDNLDKTSGNSIDVKLVRFHLALLQQDYAGAGNLLNDLKKSYPAEVRVVLAETELLVAKDQTDSAIIKLQEALEAFPRSTPVLKALVGLLAAKGDYQQCETIINNALASAEEPENKREPALLLADVFSRSKDSDKRYSLLNSLAGQLQDDIPVLRDLLTCEQVLKDKNRAQQVVDKIKSVEGEDGWQWRYEQARIWFTQADFKNHYPKIVSVLQQNLLTNPDDQSSRMLLAATYEKGDDLRLAVSTYIEALNRSPGDVRIMVPAVAAFYRAGEYDRAEDILKQAAKEGIYNPELQRLEAQSSLRRGDLVSANDVLEQMLTADPNDHSVALSLALLKIRQDKFTEAQELLDKLMAEEPNSLPVAAACAELDIRMDKPDDAIRICDDMVAKLHTASAILFRGRTNAVLNRPDRARIDFENAIKMEPNNANTWIAKSIFHRSIGESNEAVVTIRNALSLMPDNLRLKKTAVSVYLTSNDRDLYKEAETLLDKTLESNPEDIDLCLQKSRLLLAKGTAQSIEQASAILQPITEKQPEVKDAWMLLAQIALQEKEPAKAIDVCLRGLAYRPNDRMLLLLKAKAEGARSPLLAIPTLKALWEAEPNNTETAVSLAEAYMAAGENSAAVNLLKNQPLPEVASQQQILNIELAVAMYKDGSKTESEQLLQGLYESEPNDPRPLLTQIRLLRNDKLWGKLRQKIDAWTNEHSGETQTAVLISDELALSRDSESVKMAEELLRQILDRDPGSALALFRLAVLLQATGRPAEAAPLYQQVIDMQPDNLIAINNFAWILCEDQKRPQEALELIQRGLEKAPQYVDLIDTRGMAYYRLGKLDLAAKDFDECIRLYPGNNPGKVASYFHSGRCLADSGEKIRAIEQLNKAIELNKELGGLSGNDLAEAQQLLEQLKSGGN